MMSMSELTAGVIIAALGAAVTYGILRNRVSRNESDFSRHYDESLAYREFIGKRIDASFKKGDENTERIIKLEQDTSTHLDLVKAEETFVSKSELDLHIKILELNMNNVSNKVSETNNKVDSMEGKLGELIEILTQCRIDGVVK